MKTTAKQGVYKKTNNFHAILYMFHEFHVLVQLWGSEYLYETTNNIKRIS